ncbi:MAG: RNA-binding protein [Campylobacterales bacterium]
MVSNKLYVGNLNYKATSDDVKELFGQYGAVRAVKLIEGKDETGRVIKKGFGFVEFEDASDAKRAKEALSGAQFQSRALKVDFARPQQPRY